MNRLFVLLLQLALAALAGFVAARYAIDSAPPVALCAALVAGATGGGSATAGGGTEGITGGATATGGAESIA